MTDHTRKKRPRDANLLAKTVVDITTGEKVDNEPELTDAQKFAQEGGRKGGHARAKSLSAKRRAEIARNAAKMRWGNRDEG